MTIWHEVSTVRALVDTVSAPAAEPATTDLPETQPAMPRVDSRACGRTGILRRLKAWLMADNRFRPAASGSLSSGLFLRRLSDGR